MKTLNEILGPRVTKDLTVHVRDIVKGSRFGRRSLKGRRLRSRLAVSKTQRVQEQSSKRTTPDPCWDNFEQIGWKTKSGRKVPNCVPKK